MKTLNLLLITLALLASNQTYASDDEDDISLYYGRMERNAQDAETFEAQEGEGFEPVLHCDGSGPTSKFVYEKECGKKPKILFNSKVENPNEETHLPVHSCGQAEFKARYGVEEKCL